MKHERKEKGEDESYRTIKDGGWRRFRDMLLMAYGRNALGKGSDMQAGNTR